VEPTSVMPRIRMLGVPCVQSRREGASTLAPSCAVRGGSWAGVRGWECDSSPPELRVATAWVRRSCEPHVLATLALMVCPCVRSLPHPPPSPLPRAGVMPSAGTHSLLRSRTKGVRCGCDIVLLTSTSCSGFLPWRGGQGGIGPRTTAPSPSSVAAPCTTLRYPVPAV
jgi:hypothetical protein